MSLTQLKHFLAVAFLGLTLVGCSSSPEVEDADAAKSQVSGNAGNGTGANGGADVKGAAMDKAKAAEEAAAAAAKDAADRAAALLAELKGKVVNFDFDRSEVKGEFHDTIKKHADYMSLVKDASVTLSGFCDERGTPEYNLALGERRAKAVKNALVAQGISPSRISVISFGEENPVDAGHNEQAWAKNRRTEFAY